MSLRARLPTFSSCCWTLALLALASCGRDAAPRVVLAEFLDNKNPDGRATQGELIRVRLDRPFHPSFPVDEITVLTSPPVRWQFKIVPPEVGSRVFNVEISSGEPEFQIAGVFRQNDADNASTGLGFDYGDGRAPQWVDLQWTQTYPLLQRVEWKDSSRVGGDHVVNEGDQLCLYFDRPVRLEVDADKPAVEDSDVRLRNGDRLDDGTRRAQFKSATDNEVVITLGAKPLLVPDTGAKARRGSGRNGHVLGPSTFALNGTPILPFDRIVDPRNSLGAVSAEELPIEHPMKTRDTAPPMRTEFPPPGHRVFHTVTPFVGGQAVVIGGEAVTDATATGQVLVFDPYQKETMPFSGRTQTVPRFWHTATRLPGLDGVPNTLDDLIVVAGGFNGENYLDDISIVGVAPDGSLEARSLPSRLRVGRARHAAVALPIGRGGTILIDGGDGPGGQIGCAEVLTIELGDDGDVRVGEHRVFRTFARRDHTLTALGQTGQWVLAYGGFGGARLLQFRQHELPVDFGAPIQPSDPLPQDLEVAGSRVLTMPIVVNIDDPAASFKVRYAYRPALLRYGHRAARIRDSAPAGGETVLLAGGTTRHPVHGYERHPRYWDIPLGLATAPPIPEGHEAGHAVLFSFFEETPSDSRLTVVEHPDPDPTRVAEYLHPSVLAIPRLGVLLTGGEQPTSSPTVGRSQGGQLYLSATSGWHPLSFWLRTGRSRHQGYYYDGNVYLIGGIANQSEEAEFSAVEVLPVGER